MPPFPDMLVNADPPATPHPLPCTGAEPGERHGISRDQSRAPDETLTLNVRWAASFRTGGPTIDVGCVNQKHA